MSRWRSVWRTGRSTRHRTCAAIRSSRGISSRVPVSIALNETFSIGLTPEIDAAVDADGDGRHLAYGSVAGLAMKVSKSVTATLEYMAMRDQDPDRTMRSTQSLASLSVGCSLP